MTRCSRLPRGNGGIARGLTAIDKSKAGLSSAAILLELRTPHSRQRCMMAHSPFLRTPHPDRVHRSLAQRGPVTRLVVHMDAGQAFRTMVAMLAPGALRHDGSSADLAGKALKAGSMPVIRLFPLPVGFLRLLPPLLFSTLDIRTVRLAAELHIALPASGREVSARNRRPDGAAGLAVVLAVGKPALPKSALNVGKRFTEPPGGIPQAELAHARRVDDHHAGPEHDQMPVRCGYGVPGRPPRESRQPP